MKLKLLTSRVHADGRTEQWGDIIEVGEAEGKRLLASGQAMLPPDEELETAAMTIGGRGENLTRRTAIKRG